METMNLKVGDSFYFYVDLLNESNTPIDVNRSNVRCQIRQENGTLVDTLWVEKDVVLGRYLIKSIDTSKYVVGTLLMDIKIRDNDVISSTKTTKLIVEKDVSRWR